MGEYKGQINRVEGGLILEVCFEFGGGLEVISGGAS